MLIVTAEEVRELPEGAVLVDKYGTLARRVSDYSWEQSGSEDLLGFWEIGLPAQLIHPRRYGDEELGAVAAAIETRRQLSPRADSIALARAALNALEDQ